MSRVGSSAASGEALHLRESSSRPDRTYSLGRRRTCGCVQVPVEHPCPTIALTTTRDYSGSLANPRPRPASAVSIDALGTLLELQPPAPILGAALARAGFPKPQDDVERAISAEIAYYRANMQGGRDEASLAALRQECAGVLADVLPGETPPLAELTELLVSSLVFRAHPDAIPTLEALRKAGVPIVILSNWDYSLPRTLEGLGLAGFGHVLTSADIGWQKPDTRAFQRAVERLGVTHGEVLHIGDDPHRDAHGASAAGLQAVLLNRGAGPPPSGPWRTIASLSDVPALLGV